MKNDEVIKYIDDKIDNLEESIKNWFNENIISEMGNDVAKMNASLFRMDKNFSEFERNTKRFNEAILELNGSVSRCRALFTDIKDKTPVWYKIQDVHPPEKGEIWVKDIKGNEMLGTCQGRAILYPANSLCKVPEFWKPV